MRRTKKVTLTTRSPKETSERRLSNLDINLLHLKKTITDHQSPTVLKPMIEIVTSGDPLLTREGTTEEKEEDSTKSMRMKGDTPTVDIMKIREDLMRKKTLRDATQSKFLRRTSTQTMRKVPSHKDSDLITILLEEIHIQDTLSRCHSEREISEMVHLLHTLEMDILQEVLSENIPVISQTAQVSMQATIDRLEWTRSEMSLLKEMTTEFHLPKNLETSATSPLNLIEDESSL